MTSEDQQSPGSRLETCGFQDTLIIRVCGLANMHLAVTTKEFIGRSYGKGFKQFIFDLTDCAGLDSTYMGTLLFLSEDIANNEGELHLFNVNETCRKLLEMLGVASIVKLEGEKNLPELDYTVIAPMTDKKEARLDLIEQAHRRLVDISSENKERFGSFLKMLDE